jgi:Mrp family chromosome partitioning ATPase
MSHIDEALKRVGGEAHDRDRGIRSARMLQRRREYTLAEFLSEQAAPSALTDNELESKPLSSRAAPHVSRSEGSERLTPVAPVARRHGDQYERLAGHLHDAQARLGLKTLLVTSTHQREGKTAAVAHLAQLLSATYARHVLAVDAHLRRPALHEMFGVAGDDGLSDALRRPGSDRLPIVQVSPLLRVLPAGGPTADALPLLASDRMRTLLDYCTSEFDWVLVDMPAVSEGSDVHLLTQWTHAVVFVVAASASFPEVARTIASLGREFIVGTVLNGFDDRDAFDVACRSAAPARRTLLHV